MSVSRATGIPFSDKMRFGWGAVKRHGLLLVFLSLFVAVGFGLMWLAYYTDGPIFVYGIGGVFAAFALFFYRGDDAIKPDVLL